MIKNLKNLKNFIINNKYILLLVFIAIITHIEWFNPYSILTYGDWQFRYDSYIRGYLGGWNTWVEVSSLGSPNTQMNAFLFRGVSWNFLSFIGLSYDLSVKITLLFFVAIGGFLSPYFLSLKISKDKLISFSIALIYASTTYFLIIETRHLFLAFVYALAPILIYFYDEALLKPSFKRWFIFVIIFSIGVIYEIRMMYIMFFILLIYTFIHIKFLSISSWKKHFPYIAFASVVFILLNIYWILPVLFNVDNGISQITNRPLFGNNLFTVSQSFTIFRWSWTGGEDNKFFKLQDIQWYLWILPVLVFSSILFVKKNRKKIIIFLVITIVGLFLTKQSAEPFPQVYQYLYDNFPGFKLFREASKLYLITAIGYLLILSTSLPYIKEKSKILLGIILSALISVSAINLTPLVTKEISGIFIDRSNEYSKDHIEFAQFIEDKNEFFRILWVPSINSTWEYSSDKNPRLDIWNLLTTEYPHLINKDKKRFSNILNALNNPFFLEQINILSVRYIVIPPMEKDDIFFSPQGIEAQIMRKFYIEQLNDNNYFQKLEVGGSHFSVYENKNYHTHIKSIDKIYAISDQDKINKTKFLNTYSFFILNKNLENIFSSFLINPAENITPSNIKKEKINFFIKNKFYKNFDQYIHIFNTNLGLKIFEKNNKLFFKRIPTIDILINNRKINDSQFHYNLADPYVINRKFLYAITINEKTTLLDLKKSNIIHSMEKTSNIKLLNLINNNYITNGNFKERLWEEKVSDCAPNKKSKGIIGMRRGKDDTDNFLELQAKTHYACTSYSREISINENNEFLFSFEYKGINTRYAGYKISFNDKEKTIINKRLFIKNNDWNKISQKIFIPRDATNIKITFYSYYTDKIQTSLVQYKNVSLYNIYKESIIKTNKDIKKYNIVTEKNKSEEIIKVTYSSKKIDNKNIIINGDFSEGLWEEKVSDCTPNNKEKGLIGMRRGQDKNDFFLELQAKTHYACTSYNRDIPVSKNNKLLLFFKYKGINTKYVGYQISFDDKKHSSVQKRIPISNKDWNDFSQKIDIPIGANNAKLTFYSYYTNKVDTSISRYKKVSIYMIPAEIPNLLYLENKIKINNETNQKLTFKIINPTLKKVFLKNIKNNIFISMNDKYHPQWEMFVVNNKNTNKTKILDFYHIKYNNLINGWYFDTNKYCKQENKCIKNKNGTYDIYLTIEFEPQKYLYIGLIISGVTLFFILFLLFYLPKITPPTSFKKHWKKPTTCPPVNRYE